MNEQYEVPRLLDGSDPLQAELREALRVVSQDGPSALQIAQMTESVLSTVAAGAGIGAGVSTTSGALKWLALKSTWAKLALVFCTVGGAAWVIGRGLQEVHGPVQAGVRAEQTVPETTAAPTATSDGRPERADQGLPTADDGLASDLPATRLGAVDELSERENASSTAEVAAARGDDRPVVTRRPRRRARGTATRPTSARSTAASSGVATRAAAPAPTASVREPEQDTPAQEPPEETARENGPTELGLLGEAQWALAQQPATALTLLERHRRRFPTSDYAQERDALILDALSRLGRIDELNSQAASFLARYPRSPHRQRVHELLREAGESAR